MNNEQYDTPKTSAFNKKQKNKKTTSIETMCTSFSFVREVFYHESGSSCSFHVMQTVRPYLHTEGCTRQVVRFGSYSQRHGRHCVVLPFSAHSHIAKQTTCYNRAHIQQDHRMRSHVHRAVTTMIKCRLKRQELP